MTGSGKTRRAQGYEPTPERHVHDWPDNLPNRSFAHAMRVGSEKERPKDGLQESVRQPPDIADSDRLGERIMKDCAELWVERITVNLPHVQHPVATARRDAEQDAYAKQEAQPNPDDQCIGIT